jgi:hypothetical protein
LNGRLIDDSNEGFVVIVPIDAQPPVPIGCPVCKYLMRTKDDEDAYHKFGCCDRCAMLWAYPRRQQWDEGWRPSDEQLKEAELTRPPLTIKFGGC